MVKPANIFITQHGHAKILDFGLAKLIAPAGPVNVTDMPTASQAQLLTQAGTMMGTRPSMSPEQVRGEEDGRTCGLRTLVECQVGLATDVDQIEAAGALTARDHRE